MSKIALTVFNRSAFKNGLLHFQPSTLQYHGRRFLLGVDMTYSEHFKRSRESLLDMCHTFKENYRCRMEDHLSQSSAAPVLYKDVGFFMYLAESEEDLTTLINMVKRYHEYYKKPCPGGNLPRLLHVLGKADLAYELFQDKNMRCVFEAYPASILLMDLQYKHGYYGRVLDVYDALLQSHTLGPETVPRSFCSTLALAACLKVNSCASCEKAFNIYSNIPKDVSLKSRGFDYLAYLAIKQNQSSRVLKDLERTHFVDKVHRVPTMNMLALSYAREGRIAEATQVLQCVLKAQSRQQAYPGCEVFAQVVEELQRKVDELNETGKIDQKQQQAFETTCQHLRRRGHVISADLEGYILRPIRSQREGSHGGYRPHPRTARTTGAQSKGRG